MNVILTRRNNSTTFARIPEGSAYASAEAGNDNVYIKARTSGRNSYNLPDLLGKNRRGKAVGAATRLKDGEVVFHFLDKPVVAVSLPTVSAAA